MSNATPNSFTRRLLPMLLGPLIWFVHFSFIYGAAAFGASFRIQAADIRILLWGATLGACGAVGIVLWNAPRGSITGGLAFLSLVAIVFEALVLWAVPL